MPTQAEDAPVAEALVQNFIRALGRGRQQLAFGQDKPNDC